MISIVKHSFSGGDILARRFRAMRAPEAAAIVASLNLDAQRWSLDPSEEVFPQATTTHPAQLLLSGIVGEVRLLSHGRRQIMMLRLPGDVLTPVGGDTLMSLTAVRVSDASSLLTRFGNWSAEDRPLREAWMASSRTDLAILRDQVVRLGRMSAAERVGHLLLETHERLAQVGLATDNGFPLPLTQETISDIVGLSVVHLNRTLQSLKHDGLVQAGRGYVTLPDRPRLAAMAGYVSRFPMPWRPAERRSETRQTSARYAQAS